MIRDSSIHQFDTPDLSQKWTIKGGKLKYSYFEKMMHSIKHLCDKNIELAQKFNIDEIRGKLLRQEDEKNLEN